MCTVLEAGGGILLNDDPTACEIEEVRAARRVVGAVPGQGWG